MLQFLHLTHLPRISSTFFTQLQRYVGDSDPLTHITLEWILALVKVVRIADRPFDDNGRFTPKHDYCSILYAIGLKTKVPGQCCIEDMYPVISRIGNLDWSPLPVNTIRLVDETIKASYTLTKERLSFGWLMRVLMRDSTYMESLVDNYDVPFIRDGALVFVESVD